MSLLEDATLAFRQAFADAGLPAPSVPLAASPNPSLGDLASSEALGLARKLGKPPREIAVGVAERLTGCGIFARIGVDGPGYVNVSFADEAIERAATTARAPAAATGRTVLVDFGGPNVAKDLHVGHLRSGVIGDALMRIGAETGHDMVSDLHAGDWGLPVGMLIAELGDDSPPGSVEALNELYVRASTRCKADAAALEAAKAATVALQNEEPEAIAKWRCIAALSVASALAVFARLGIHFTHAMGESDSRLFVEETERRLAGALREDDGAQVVGTESGNVVFRKSDGGLTYAATDLATLVQRTYAPAPDEILYVVDARQAQHFRQIFEVARSRLIPEGMAVEHVSFGTVNGADGKPLRTRDGGVPKLSGLLDEAIEACADRLRARGVDDAAKASATALGIGAVRFADLATPRETGYAFDLAQMTSAEGRTGPYLAYSITRARGVVRKGAGAGHPIGAAKVAGSKARRALLLAVAGYPDALRSAWERRAPHLLCNHALEVAEATNALYQAGSVLREADESERAASLGAFDLAETHLTHVMRLLGIEVPERM